MDATARHGLPFILPGQAQKEMFHNEALQMLDALVAAAVEEPPRPSPPSSPAAGACYIVASNPTGDWASKANHLAAYTPGGLRYLAPVEGLSVFVKSTGTVAAYRNSAWELGVVRASRIVISGNQVVGERQVAIADPTGGTQVDAEARSAIAAMLAAMRAHGLIAS